MGEDVRGAHPNEYVGSGDHVRKLTLLAFRVCPLGKRLSPSVEAHTAVEDGSLGVNTDDVRGPGSKQHLANCDTGRSDTRNHDREILQFLSSNPQGVLQGGKDHHRSAVLVVVENRNVERLLECLLNLECSRGRDVFKIDATKGRSQTNNGFDDLFGRRYVKTDREGINAAELLEQQSLALHHRHCSFCTDVAEAKYGRAVGNDCDRILANGVLVGEGFIGSNRVADSSNTGGVRH